MPIAVGYVLEGRNIDYVPASIESCRHIEIISKNLPCANKDISSVRDFANLPNELTHLISQIESTSCPVRGIGVGPQRDQFVLKS